MDLFAMSQFISWRMCIHSAVSDNGKKFGKSSEILWAVNDSARREKKMSKQRDAQLKSLEECGRESQSCTLTHQGESKTIVGSTYAFFRQHPLLQKIILSHLPSRMDMYMRVPTGNKYCSIRGHTFFLDRNQVRHFCFLLLIRNKICDFKGTVEE